MMLMTVVALTLASSDESAAETVLRSSLYASEIRGLTNADVDRYKTALNLNACNFDARHALEAALASMTEDRFYALAAEAYAQHPERRTSTAAPLAWLTPAARVVTGMSLGRSYFPDEKSLIAAAKRLPDWADRMPHARRIARHLPQHEEVVKLRLERVELEFDLIERIQAHALPREAMVKQYLVSAAERKWHPSDEARAASILLTLHGEPTKALDELAFSLESVGWRSVEPAIAEAMVTAVQRLRAEVVARFDADVEAQRIAHGGRMPVIFK